MRVGREPPENGVDRPLRDLELRHVAHPPRDLELPGRVRGRGGASRRDVDQAVPVAMDEQHGHVDRPLHRGKPAPIGQHPHQGLRCDQHLGVDIGVLAAQPRKLDVEVDDVARHPRRVRAAQAQQRTCGLFCCLCIPASAEHPASDHRHQERCERREHARVGPCVQGQGQRRIHQHEPGHSVMALGRLKHRDEAAHRVAHQDRRRTGDLGEEAVQQPLVGLHRGGAGPASGVPEARQVQGHDPAALGQDRGHRRPIDRRATQPVDQHQQGAIRRTAIVEVVHRAIQIRPPGLRLMGAPRPSGDHALTVRPQGGATGQLSNDQPRQHA